jgi:hypothetical protein
MGQKLSIEQLRETAAFKKLRQRQQALVENYLSNGGDEVSAITAVYKCSQTSARTERYVMFQNPKILEVLALAAGAESPALARFTAELERAMRSKHTTPQNIKALQLFARVHGLAVSVPEPESKDKDERQKFCVGDIVTQAGKKYRIEAVELENV